MCLHIPYFCSHAGACRGSPIKAYEKMSSFLLNDPLGSTLHMKKQRVKEAMSINVKRVFASNCTLKGEPHCVLVYTKGSRGTRIIYPRVSCSKNYMSKERPLFSIGF